MNSSLNSECSRVEFWDQGCDLPALWKQTQTVPHQAWCAYIWSLYTLDCTYHLCRKRRKHENNMKETMRNSFIRSSIKLSFYALNSTSLHSLWILHLETITHTKCTQRQGIYSMESQWSNEIHWKHTDTTSFGGCGHRRNVPKNKWWRKQNIAGSFSRWLWCWKWFVAWVTSCASFPLRWRAPCVTDTSVPPPLCQNVWLW